MQAAAPTLTLGLTHHARVLHREGRDAPIAGFAAIAGFLCTEQQGPHGGAQPVGPYDQWGMLHGVLEPQFHVVGVLHEAGQPSTGYQRSRGQLLEDRGLQVGPPDDITQAVGEAADVEAGDPATPGIGRLRPPERAHGQVPEPRRDIEFTQRL